MTTLRSLNSEGVLRFRSWLGEARASKKRPKQPDYLLHDERFSTDVSEVVELPVERFSSAWDAAEALSAPLSILPPHELESSGGLGNVGLWSWLALLYFDEVCPKIPLATNRYIPETEGAEAGLRYYRHLLAGPFRMYRQLGKLAAPALNSPLSSHNVLYRSFADHQDFVQNPGIVEAMNLLYFDPKAGALRRGLANADAPGTLARFFPVMQQLELNYDLLGMSADEIIELLPFEFDYWVNCIDTAEPDVPPTASDLDTQTLSPSPETEEAEESPTSRQQRYQTKMKATGACIVCGKPSVNASHCAFHRQQARESRMRAYHKSKKRETQ